MRNILKNIGIVATLIFFATGIQQAQGANSTSQEIRSLKKQLSLLQKSVLDLQNEVSTLQSEQSLVTNSISKIQGMSEMTIKFASLGSSGCPKGSIAANNQGVSVVTRSFGSEGTVGIGTCQMQVLAR